MTKRPSLFTNSSSTFTSGDSIGLREEFDEFLFGTDGTSRKGFPILVRHMRRDAEGNKIDCVCKGALTKSPDPDCSYCFGEGYYWDESWYITRSQFISSAGGRANMYRHAPPGEIKADTKMFFFRYDVPLKYGDKIVEVELDLEGNAASPLRRLNYYKPQVLDFLRGDHGRIEFITVYCLEKDAIRLDE